MTIPRYAAKRDNVEQDLIKILKGCGISVERTDQPFDALLHFRGKTYVAEFKDPKMKGKKNEFTDDQHRFFHRHPGWPVEIFRTQDDVTEFVRRVTT